MCERSRPIMQPHHQPNGRPRIGWREVSDSRPGLDTGEGVSGFWSDLDKFLLQGLQSCFLDIVEASRAHRVEEVSVVLRGRHQTEHQSRILILPGSSLKTLNRTSIVFSRTREASDERVRIFLGTDLGAHGGTDWRL